MMGLNVRTIQRIDSCKRASLESVKSVAAALETSIAALEQETITIDKAECKWKSLPLFFRLNFWGLNIS